MPCNLCYTHNFIRSNDIQALDHLFLQFTLINVYFRYHMAFCSAINCNNSKKKNPQLSFFTFPKERERCKKWIINTRRKNVTEDYAHKNLTLCSEHFEDSQFFSVLNKNRLERYAVPTLFQDLPNPPEKIATKRKLPDRNHPLPPKKKRRSEQPKNDLSDDKADYITDNDIDDANDTFGTKVNEELFDFSVNSLDDDSTKSSATQTTPTTSEHSASQTTPTSLKHSRTQTIKEFSQHSDCKKASKKASRKIKRQETTIAKLRNKVKNLKRASGGNRKRQTSSVAKEDVIEFINANFDKGTALLLSTQVRLVGRKKKGARFSNKDKELALSLYYQSAKAYKFLCKYLRLPSVSRLRKWIKNVNIQPGISDFVLKAIERKVALMPEKEKVVSLILDEMKLSPGLSYDKHNDVINGFEDFGPEEGRTQQAADHALVFMIRGMESGWKQSVGHYFCKSSTSGHILNELVHHALGK